LALLEPGKEQRKEKSKEPGKEQCKEPGKEQCKEQCKEPGKQAQVGIHNFPKCIRDL